MRVLYWADLFPPYIGGLEVFSGQLVRALAQRGHEFMIVTSHGERNLPDHSDFQGVPVYRLPFLQALRDRDLRKIKQLGQQVLELKHRFRPTLVHMNLSAGGTPFFHLRTHAADPSPTLVTIHAFQNLGFGPRGLLGEILRSADGVAAVSEAMLSDVRGFVPEITPRSRVIYNSLETPSVQPAPLSFAAPRLLCVGRVVTDKGFDLAVTALATLVARFPEARLMIAGDGPAKASLQRHAASLGLSDKVDFPGWVLPEQIPELINAATVVLMPSRWREPFGLVALQAAQMGRPIVAARVGGLPEVVVHEQTGLLVEKDDALALGAAVTFLLEHQDVAREMGHAARRRAAQRFGFARFVDAYEAAYRHLGGAAV